MSKSPGLEQQSRELTFSSIDDYELLFIALDAGCRHERRAIRRRLYKLGEAALSQTLDGSRDGYYPEFMIKGDDAELTLGAMRHLVREQTARLDELQPLDRFTLAQALTLLEAAF